MLTSFTFLLFLGVVLYGVQFLVTRVSEVPLPHYLLAAREDRVIFLGREYDGVSIFDEFGMKMDPETAPAKAISYRGYLGQKEETQRFIVVQGKNQGMVQIQPMLKGVPSGKPFVVHVRGILPSIFDEYVDEAEALRRAELKVKEALILRDNQRYDALKRLEEANRYFEMARAMDRRVETDLLVQELKSGLSSDLKKLFADAYESLKQRSGRARDANSTIQLCEEIKQQVPDELSLEWQMANELQIYSRPLIGK